jgi:hypothetical protein
MTTLRIAVLVLAIAALSGCSTPCDAFCDASANYIEFCLENGSQGDWRAANDGLGWGVWNASEKTDYVSSCQTDFDSQLAAANDVVESECTDLANQYQENADRGFCVDLP